MWCPFPSPCEPDRDRGRHTYPKALGTVVRSFSYLGYSATHGVFLVEGFVRRAILAQPRRAVAVARLALWGVQVERPELVLVHLLFVPYWPDVIGVLGRVATIH